ncbi:MULTISPECIES: hypothetical protein [unclassified Actinomyces]|uniref:hypothetical protein n=1 Tax=unclassified Actinomyces TaxID=2609248 RepID=UPI0020182066|nr:MULTISPECIES: hypothetical protein [unclassified Actinomyces]MCL3778651.1 hypothetical protein [Actinomyces sp. AC-20-1]MCL3790579.1 hypothetical protein [Actinomyces sp. 187325]MCL3792876.1 hypothetical protein [Actinomyces sp. 186855]MCL3795336.1 hypothetical protein [Actinomyces sp. 217892]
MLTPAVLLAHLGGGAPATPDAEEARGAAERELTRPVYQERQSLWARLWEWLQEHIDPSRVVPGAPAWLSVLIVVVAVVVLLAVLLLLLRRVTLGRRAHTTSRLLFEGDDRDSRALTRDADAAAARQDWATAVVDRFRAIIRSLDERALVEDYPGMTAQEAGVLASMALLDVQGLHASLHQAAVLFDAVRYGRVVSTGQQDEWMRLLAERVASAEPRPPAQRAPAGVQGVGV